MTKTVFNVSFLVVNTGIFQCMNRLCVSSSYINKAQKKHRSALNACVVNEVKANQTTPWTKELPFSCTYSAIFYMMIHPAVSS